MRRKNVHIWNHPEQKKFTSEPPKPESEFKKLRRKAEMGDATAQCNLGYEYDTQKNYVEAAKWYRKSAEQGDCTTQHNMGVMYYNGQGVSKDEETAMKWYEKATKQGHQGAAKMVSTLKAQIELPKNLRSKIYPKTTRIHH